MNKYSIKSMLDSIESELEAKEKADEMLKLKNYIRNSIKPNN
jgi:hypothetical protein